MPPALMVVPIAVAPPNSSSVPPLLTTVPLAIPPLSTIWVPPLPTVAHWWTAPPSPERYAHHLYEFLHRMDASSAERLVVQRPPREPQWAALNDRLERAAAAFSGTYDDAD